MYKRQLIYIVPDFQNPTGRTWSLARRRQLAELSAKYNVVVIEDNPYGELRYEGDFLPSVKSFDKEGNVLCTGTFSKIFCPGYRIGWIAGEKEVIRKYVLVKHGLPCWGWCRQNAGGSAHPEIPGRCRS